jgi:hypothetical protein
VNLPLRGGNIRKLATRIALPLIRVRFVSVFNSRRLTHNLSKSRARINALPAPI